jgi:hypothetical protein
MVTAQTLPLLASFSSIWSRTEGQDNAVQSPFAIVLRSGYEYRCKHYHGESSACPLPKGKLMKMSGSFQVPFCRTRELEEPLRVKLAQQADDHFHYYLTYHISF